MLRWPLCWILLLQALGGQHAAEEHKLCSNPVPGLDRMSLGVDITSFDLYSKDNVGLKHQVIQFTCDRGKTKTIDGNVYDLPDQVGSVTAVPGGIYSSVVDIIRTHSDSRKSVAKDFGVEGTFKYFGFSASQSLTSMQHSIFNKSSYVERVSAFESARRAHMIPDFLLKVHEYAQYYIDEYLPEDFAPTSADERNPYREFIRYFGTHYFVNANFGGMLLVNLETKSDYYLKHDENTVKKQAKASFMKILGASGGRVTSSTNVDESFKSKTTVTTRYFGGTTNLLKPNGIQEWQPTVSTHPWLFSGKLALISNLVRNESKRTSMERAVTDYVLRDYLDELSRLMSSRQWTWTQGLSKLQQLQSRVGVLKAKTLLTEAEVKALSDDVVHQVSIPRWFSEKTKLCYDWYRDGNAQCEGPARTLCALPGLMTSAYRDDTDGRSGGCRMAWGLKASNHEAWFNDVQVCYRWHPDGNGGQCGGGAARLLCAKVNAFTKHYRDDTDGRGGGCQMSWRLIVPSSAPVWAHNMQLCYVWWPDGDGGQCGGGAARRLCAKAGSWTGYYRDDTDHRGGGCRMTWGIHVPLP